MEHQIVNDIFLGVSLGAACGFRAFLPAFLYAVAVATGHLETAPAFTWLASTPAIVVFGAASAAEIAASFVGAADRFLDLAETPTPHTRRDLYVAAVAHGDIPDPYASPDPRLPDHEVHRGAVGGAQATDTNRTAPVVSHRP